MKGMLYRLVIRPATLHGAKTWTITWTQENKADGKMDDWSDKKWNKYFTVSQLIKIM